MFSADLSARADAKESSRMKPEVFLPDDYRPAEDEPFMNDRQLEYFRRKLIVWKQELLGQSAETIDNLQDSGRNVPDIADRASEETDRALELRTRDRQRKLVGKIDAALRRIESGEYGYCEMTGEPISLKRLDARPIAIMTLEAQEKPRAARKGASRRLIYYSGPGGCAGRGEGGTWAGPARSGPFLFGIRMSLTGQSVTIVGAGVAGLAAARALALRGAEVTVLEQADAIREVGAGLQISPNGAAVLKALGLAAALEAASMRAQAVELRDGMDGSLVTRLEVARLRPGQGYHFLHRADLIEFLLEGARDAGVELRLSAKGGAGGSVGRPAAAGDVDGCRGGARASDRCRWAAFAGADRAERQGGAVLHPSGGLAHACARRTGGSPGRRGAYGAGAASGQLSAARRHPAQHRGGRGAAALGRRGLVAARRSRWSCGWPSNASGRECVAGWNRSRMSGSGACSGIRWRKAGIGRCRAAVWRFWATRRIRRCPFWRRAPAWGWRMPGCWPPALPGRTGQGPGLRPIRQRGRPRAARIVEAANRNARAYHLSGPVRSMAHLGLRLGGTVRARDWR